jgi:hypothetical protein
VRERLTREEVRQWEKNEKKGELSPRDRRKENRKRGMGVTEPRGERGRGRERGGKERNERKEWK